MGHGKAKRKSIQGGFRGQKVMGLDYVTWFLLGKTNISELLFTQKSKKDKVLYANNNLRPYFFKLRFIATI